MSLSWVKSDKGSSLENLFFIANNSQSAEKEI